MNLQESLSHVSGAGSESMYCCRRRNSLYAALDMGILKQLMRLPSFLSFQREALGSFA
jgi:hypothetical protein